MRSSGLFNGCVQSMKITQILHNGKVWDPNDLLSILQKITLGASILFAFALGADCPIKQKEDTSASTSKKAIFVRVPSRTKKISQYDQDRVGQLGRKIFQLQLQDQIRQEKEFYLRLENSLKSPLIFGD